MPLDVWEVSKSLTILISLRLLVYFLNPLCKETQHEVSYHYPVV